MADKTVFMHDSMSVEAGKTVFMHDYLLVDIEHEAIDINNDFRTREYWTLNDIANDFRMVGTFALADINNDFRFSDWAVDDINNDFRMVGAPTIRVDFNNDFRSRKEQLYNINNKFQTVKEEANDIDNKFNSCIEVEKDFDNIVSWVKEEIYDVNNDFRSRLETRNDIANDFRMVAPWQVPEAGEVGFQSAGKTEVKIYINDVEQTDVDLNSVTYTENLNAPCTASFNLGRAYDASKPSEKDVVKIKYKGILLYQGYIININPTDSPENIRIDCQDEYWNINKTKKYFLVGRKPADAREFYYETIKDGLNDLGLTYDVGNFIPQTMNLYGTGHADAITQLIQNAGNYNWFIKPDGTKCLWEADRGSIVNLEKQVIGTNLGLYQVIRHNIRENIVGLINRLKVQMGNWTIREGSSDVSKGSGTTYAYTQNIEYDVWAEPAWDESLEKLAKNSSDGYGYDHQDPTKDYSDVFRKFWIPEFETGWHLTGDYTESLTDLYPPLIEIYTGSGYSATSEYKDSGFSVDYGYKPAFGIGSIGNIGRPNLTLSEPQFDIDYTYFGIQGKEPSNLKAKKIRLKLWKEYRFSYTVGSGQTNPDDEPVASPLMFYTTKMGDYSETITGDLNVSGLSIQEGYTLLDENGEIIQQIPSWDDTLFAKDYADWQLSKTCDVKKSGSIDITIDNLLYNNIDLGKRIQIPGIVTPINIKSISVNFNSWIATLNVEKNRFFKRSVSIPYRGE